MWIDASTPSHESNKHTLWERIYFYLEKWEVYPPEKVKWRYGYSLVPEAFQEAFDLFIETDIMKIMSEYIWLYGDNYELFLKKYSQYLDDLFHELINRLNQGILFWNYLHDRKIPTLSEKSSDDSDDSMYEFLVRYKESVKTALNFAIHPNQGEQIIPSDIAERSGVYYDLLKRVWVKVRNIAP